MYLAYFSKCNSTREKQVNLLMIRSGEIREVQMTTMAYLAVKKIISIVRKDNIKNHGDFIVGIVFFFLSGFSFTTIHESQDCRGRGRAFL